MPKNHYKICDTQQAKTDSARDPITQAKPKSKPPRAKSLHSVVSCALKDLKGANNLRSTRDLKRDALYVWKDYAHTKTLKTSHKATKLCNFASNDYLGLASDDNQAFFDFIKDKGLGEDTLRFSSSSSRLLSGGFEVSAHFESYISSLFSPKSALLFNSGYHLNLSVIAALGTLESILFLADEFVHASMIDGLLLSRARFKRFPHNDIRSLATMLDLASKQYAHIIILSEGIFSMEGDMCNLEALVALKKQYDNVYLYLDEAHSLGVLGRDGLGLAQEKGLSEEVDFLVFAFGKALGSVGACIVCAKPFREFFVNKARALIYSTALPPINIAFSYFAFCLLPFLQERREKLQVLSAYFKTKLQEKAQDLTLESTFTADTFPFSNTFVRGELQIVSLVLGSNEFASKYARKLADCGFFAPAIKEPTIPKNTARIRFCLNAKMDSALLDSVCEAL